MTKYVMDKAEGEPLWSIMVLELLRKEDLLHTTTMLGARARVGDHRHADVEEEYDHSYSSSFASSLKSKFSTSTIDASSSAHFEEVSEEHSIEKAIAEEKEEDTTKIRQEVLGFRREDAFPWKVDDLQLTTLLTRRYQSLSDEHQTLLRCACVLDDAFTVQL